ncbi:hypothetical protein [Demequina zhanjiangensis]|uniref:Uncharacterized protein n=1 Tax=Demequina zhanjiangensis TaxID=3051659 RepID=A0ABT8FXJ2_9MICO|nr:hypothetical protein [Demequina sp. SYSU T00b26]MDN4471399.1 hypothetical protein [Demequina sp. SYSU T00b26]
MSELNDMLHAARDAAGRGVSVDTGDRADLMRRVGKGRRRRTMGSVAAGLAGLLVVGAATVGLAYSSPDGSESGPAAPSTDVSPSSPAPSGPVSVAASAPEGPAYEMDVAGGGTVQFATWSDDQLAPYLGEGPRLGPLIEPVPARELEGYGAGWAFLTDADVGYSGVPQESLLLLARPDGTAVEVADLTALAEPLSLGRSVAVADVRGSVDAPRVMVALAGSNGAAVVWLDLESGVTWVMLEAGGLGHMSLSWRGGDTWLAWSMVDAVPLGVSMTADEGGASAGGGAWVPWSSDPSSIAGVYAAGGVAVAFGEHPGGVLLVDRADVVVPLEREGDAILGRRGDCYLLDDGEGGIRCLSATTGEASRVEGLSEPQRSAASRAVLGDGYLEGPSYETEQSTAIWHRPGGDLEIEVPVGSELGALGDGDGVWLITAAGAIATEAHAGVIGTDGAFHEVDLPLSEAGAAEQVYVFPVG